MDVIEQWPIAPIAAGACEIKVKPQMAQPGGSKLREPNPAHMLQIGDLRGCVTRCLAPGDNVAHCPAGAGITRKKNCLWLAQSSAATFARLGLLYGPAPATGLLPGSSRTGEVALRRGFWLRPSPGSNRL